MMAAGSPEDLVEEETRPYQPRSPFFLEWITPLRNTRDILLGSMLTGHFGRSPLYAFAAAISATIKVNVWDHEEWMKVEDRYGPLDPSPDEMDVREYMEWLWAIVAIMRRRGMIARRSYRQCSDEDYQEQSSLYLEFIGSMKYCRDRLWESIGSGSFEIMHLFAFSFTVSLALDRNVEDQPEWKAANKQYGVLVPRLDSLNPNEYMGRLNAILNIMRRYSMIAEPPPPPVLPTIHNLWDYFPVAEGYAPPHAIEPRMISEEETEELLERIYKPGSVIASTAIMGGGKSHFAIGTAQWNVQTRPEVHLLTNIIFIRCIGYKYLDDGGHVPVWEKHWPDGVTFIDTMEALFQQTAEILTDDPAAVIIVLLDEFQNFIISDNPTDKLSQAFLRYIANLRKFHHVLQCISPSIRNIPKRIRQFKDDPGYAGYLSAHFFKSKYEVDEFNRHHGSAFSEKEITLLKMSYDDKWPRMLAVPVTEWCQPWEVDPEAVQKGDHLYDHLSSATFETGEGFDFGALVKAIGGCPHYEVPGTISAFFEQQAKEEDPAVAALLLGGEIARMRAHKIPWDTIGDIKQISARQCQRLLREYEEAPWYERDPAGKEEAKA